MRSVVTPGAARTPRIGPLAGRVLRRAPLDNALDAVRFRIDTFPRRLGVLRLLRSAHLESATPYQDLPWVGLEHARRGAASQARWEVMLPLIEGLQVRSAVDIGANAGWFCFAFDRAGVPAVAIDSEERNLRIGIYARRHAPQPSQVQFMLMDVEPDTVDLLPPGDAVLFLAVWHHVVKARGFATASALLRGIWGKTGRVLFFETGELELPEGWGLPEMAPDPRTWLTRYLASVCEGGNVVHVGSFDAGIGAAQRNLFAVVR